MVSLLALSVVVRGFEPCLVKPKTIKLVFVASLLSTQPSVVRAKIACFRIRSVCQSGVKSLPEVESEVCVRVERNLYLRWNQKCVSEWSEIST